MGRIEKLVVLVVLFAITAILVVSMNTRTPGGSADQESLAKEGAGERHWSPTQELLDAQPDQADPALALESVELSGAVRGGPEETGAVAPSLEALPQPLLNSEVREQSLAEKLGAIPAEWDLVQLAGLSETVDPATLLYTCTSSDSFESLAERYYGDAKKAALLRRYNEGVRNLQSGRTLFVPVVDDTPLESVREYTVLEGDNLWGIAKKVYGKGTRWEEIFNANSTLLSTPDSLRAGMVLRVP